MSIEPHRTAFPFLETERLVLRQATPDDSAAIFTIFTDPKVTEFHNLDLFQELDEAIAVIEHRTKAFESGSGIRWGIALKPNLKLIGSCGLTFCQGPDLNTAEIGYELISQRWRQGIMSEALSTILRYGFGTQKLDTVVARVMLDNIASKKLLEKLGFKSQGILNQQGFWKGQHHNLEQWVLKKAKFGSLQARGDGDSS